MTKRILDCSASDFAVMGRKELLESIAAAEGRTLVSETIGIIQPMLGEITNAEFACAMGADLVLLNMFDVQHPVIRGLLAVPAQDTVRELKRLIGRKVGINLEPVDAQSHVTEGMWAMSPGRAATAENAVAAADLGVDLIMLTGNPGNGVSNPAIVDSLQRIRAACGDRLVLAAGKMHASGVLGEAGSAILTTEDIDQFIEAGADIILLPAPCTVPGITEAYATMLIEHAHKGGALAMTAIGTSQEGADAATIRQIALQCKAAGADLHHIGDAGYGGIALPENIFAYSLAIRGVRHTYGRMARSVNR